MFRLTSNKWISLVLLFPPIMLEQWSIVSTEPIILAALLFQVLLVKNKTYTLALMISGLSWWIRPIGAVSGLALLLVLAWRDWLHVRNKGLDNYWQTIPKACLNLSLYLLPIATFIIWNLIVFEHPLYQFTVYTQVGRAQLAIPQLVADIFRALDWGWYRQLISGLIYLTFLVSWLTWLTYSHLKSHTSLLTHNWIKLSALGFLLFIFSVGPTPFLEEFPRFLVPVFPLLWLLSWHEIKKRSYFPWILGTAVILSLVVTLV